ncbi:MAG: glutathione S-transferase [Alphaproteobacteria bacterium HGW-Alphaproteobacteria-16]|nr:MAG: glutathione S-transferase [Alphaproteobacteria bacterium HGW-Alphaproteobacteria-16]
MELFAHPFSSYCWKAIIALYEHDLPFTLRIVAPDEPENSTRWAELWPFKRFPLLVDGELTLAESSIIIEHVDRKSGNPRLIPTDADLALQVRMLDRVFDNYVMNPATGFVFNAIRPADKRDPLAEENGGALLDTAYRWIDAHMAGREWAVGDDFTLADIAAAPALFYADWIHPIPDSHANVRAYRARLLARPSIARVVEEARPYRPLFPLGAPDRD